MKTLMLCIALAAFVFVSNMDYDDYILAHSKAVPTVSDAQWRNGQIAQGDPE